MHIPKTAGMTIRQALSSQYSLDEKLPAETWDELIRNEVVSVSDYLLFVGHFRYFFRDALPEETFSFTFLRDPARRTLSHLNHYAADPLFGDLHALARGRDIRSLIEDRQIISRCSNTQVAYLSKSPVMLTESMLRGPQLAENTFIGPLDLESAIDNLKRLSFVGLYEDLQADFARVCDALGLHPPPELPVTNSARDRNQTDVVGEEVMEMLREVNQLDYSLIDAAHQWQPLKWEPQPREQRCRALVERGVYEIIRKPIEFKMAGPFPAIGIWQQELANDTVFRWTGPGRSLIFELPLDSARTYKLELCLASPQPVGPLAAFVDGVNSPMNLKMLNSRVATVEITVIPTIEKPITAIELRCERTVRPAGDRRALGTVISKVVIRPDPW
jgi:hypothetical protein